MRKCVWHGAETPIGRRMANRKDGWQSGQTDILMTKERNKNDIKTAFK